MASTALLAAALLFRLPILLNAAAVNSDAAVVGLQARRLLAGEWSWFLWGIDYQSSIDPATVALAFLFLGSDPVALMLMPVAGQLLLTWLAFDVLRKRVGVPSAWILCVALVAVPMALNFTILYAARQWCVTLVFLAVWLIDGAGESGRPRMRIAAGAATAVLALYVDWYVIHVIPAMAVYAFWRVPRRQWPVLVAGAIIAVIPVWWLRQDAGTGAFQIDFARIPHNFEIFWSTCLPWLLGYKVFIPGQELYPQLWQAPAAYTLIARAGAVIFTGAVASAALLAFARTIPREVRALGLLGLLTAAAAVGGFLVSKMPSDMWTSRYLATVVWFAPFAMAPLAYLLATRVLFPALVPYFVAASVGGWLSYGPFVKGIMPVISEAGSARAEMEVATFLRDRGIRHGAAQYWLAYRLTFLYREDPVIVPLDAGEDRYRPYRDAYDRASAVALIFHPSEPRATPEPYLQMFESSRTRFERVDVAGFTVLIVER